MKLTKEQLIRTINYQWGKLKMSSSEKTYYITDHLHRICTKDPVLRKTMLETLLEFNINEPTKDEELHKSIIERLERALKNPKNL